MARFIQARGAGWRGDQESPHRSLLQRLFVGERSFLPAPERVTRPLGSGAMKVLLFSQNRWVSLPVLFGAATYLAPQAVSYNHIHDPHVRTSLRAEVETLYCLSYVVGMVVVCGLMRWRHNAVGNLEAHRFENRDSIGRIAVYSLVVSVAFHITVSFFATTHDLLYWKPPGLFLHIPLSFFYVAWATFMIGVLLLDIADYGERLTLLARHGGVKGWLDAPLLNGVSNHYWSALALTLAATIYFSFVVVAGDGAGFNLWWALLAVVGPIYAAGIWGLVARPMVHQHRFLSQSKDSVRRQHLDPARDELLFSAMAFHSMGVGEELLARYQVYEQTIPSWPLPLRQVRAVLTIAASPVAASILPHLAQAIAARWGIS